MSESRRAIELASQAPVVAHGDVAHRPEKTAELRRMTMTRLPARRAPSSTPRMTLMPLAHGTEHGGERGAG